MKLPPQPFNEDTRLKALREYELLDTLPEQALDDLTELAAHICGSPIALISLVDEKRQWFKSKFGLTVGETPRDVSFCAHALLEPGLFIVPDAAQDDRFADNPLVTGDPGIRFYAGALLFTPEGLPIGTLCVIDRMPRQLTEPQVQALRVLSRQVMTQLDLRRQTRELVAREARLRAIFDTEPECVKLLASDGSLLEMNPAGLRMLEADSFQEVENHCVYPLVVEEDRAAFKALTAKVFAGESGQVEFQIVGLKGGRRWLETHATPLRDEADKITALLGITRDITAHKQADAASRESEQKYSLLFDKSAIAAMLIKLPEMVIVESNAALAKLVGHTKQEMAGKTTLALGIVSSDSATRRQAISEFEQQGSLLNYETQVFHKSGEERIVVTNTNSLELGGERHAIVTMQDITERKHTETYIRQLNRVYSVLSGINQTIVREKDSQALLTTACKIVVEKGGFRLAWIGLIDAASNRLQISAHCCGEHPDTLAILTALIAADPPAGCAFTQRALETGSHAACNDIARDPQAALWREVALQKGYRAMAAFPLKVRDQVIGILNLYATETGFFDAEELRLIDELAMDISYALENHKLERHHQQAEQNLRASEERFRQVVENIREVFWITDPVEHQLLYISPAYETIWGRTCTSLYESPDSWLDAIHPDDRARVAAANTEQALGRYDETFRIVRPDGSVRWIRDRAFPVYNSVAEAYRVVGTAEDITAQKNADRLALRSQRLESIGTLAGGLAHDLNNALAPITLGVEVLMSQYPEESEMLEIFQASAQRGTDMVRQLVSFARGAEGERVSVSLGQLIKEMQKILQGTFPKNIHLDVNCSPTLPAVLGDATQLHQIILNLCVNARDAMPNGGVLTLEAQQAEVDAAYASSIPDATPGHFAVLRVSDTGAGISPAIIDRIFDPFFTTKGPDKGTGLGLSTVMGIVKGHGGFLQVYSKPGHGSTFAAYIPVDRNCSEVASIAREASRFQGQGQTILFVDDENALREVGRAVLRRLNFTPLTATDGADGLIQVAEHRSELCAIITDLHMPHMDGLAFVRALRRLLPDIPVVVTSGRMEVAVAAEFSALGVTSRLDKPFTEAQLAKVLMKALAPV